MSQYKAYPKYKDSGIEWIGQVPEHWEVKPFFALVTELNRKNTGLIETNILSLSYGNIIQKPKTRHLGLSPESYETYQIVEPGEIVFRFTDLQNDKRSLRSAQVTQRGIITSAYMAVKPHSVDPMYFAGMMRSYDLCKVFYAMGGGLRQSLKFEDVRRLPLPIPPPNEQAAIAATLDRETARIDGLIEKKTRFIELLKEKRQALITHTVTKGLDPNVKMKDSGIEWIGQVPEHWEVKPFFALVTELSRKNIGLVESNILSLSYGNIIQRPETRNLGLTPESYETYQIVEPDEIVFRFTDLQNDKRSLRSAMVTQKGIITSAYMAVKTHGVKSSYFAWIMRSYDLCKVFYAMGGGLRQSLRFEDVKRLLVLVPPYIEQRDIANAINAETARIDTLVEKTKQSITLLKERRAAFITAAVTGQIDLRGEQ